MGGASPASSSSTPLAGAAAPERLNPGGSSAGAGAAAQKQARHKAETADQALLHPWGQLCRGLVLPQLNIWNTHQMGAAITNTLEQLKDCTTQALTFLSRHLG